MSALFDNLALTQYVLLYTLAMPLCGIALLIFIPDTNGRLLHQVGFYSASATLVTSTFL
jgi:hypothetical protein